MKTAFEIQRHARNSADAMRLAADYYAEADQEWAAETTLFTFPDASVLLVSGPDVKAYSSEHAIDAVPRLQAHVDKRRADGVMQVEDDAEVQRAEDCGGTWVQAWVWVPDVKISAGTVE